MDVEETFLFLSNRRDWEQTPNSRVKGSGANLYPRAPALKAIKSNHIYLKSFFVNNTNISQRLFSQFVVLKNQQYYSEIFVFLKLGHFQPQSR